MSTSLQRTQAPTFLEARPSTSKFQQTLHYRNGRLRGCRRHLSPSDERGWRETPHSVRRTQTLSRRAKLPSPRKGITRNQGGIASMAALYRRKEDFGLDGSPELAIYEFDTESVGSDG